MGPGRDERADSRNRQRADPGQPPEGTTENAARDAARCCAFRRLRVLFVSEVLGAALIREQHRNVIAGKVGVLELIDNADCLVFAFRDTEYRCF